MDGQHDTDTDSLEEGPLTPNRFGAIAAIFDVLVFTFVGYFVVGAPLAGALAGLFVGAGIFFVLPVFMWADAAGGLEAMEPADAGHPLRSFHRVAAGFSLSAGGLACITWLFATPNPLTGALVAIVVAAGLYVPLAWLLPNAKL